MATENPYEADAALADSEQAMRDASWALVLGAVSLLICAPVAAPFALWKATRALAKRGSSRAVVGIVLASLGLLSSTVFWFLAIWQFLSPGPVRTGAP
jgi:hypothetical protein